MDSQKLIKPFRVEDGKKFRLKDIDTTDTRGIKSKQRATELLEDVLTARATRTPQPF